MHTQGEGPGPTPTAKHLRSSEDVSVYTQGAGYSRKPSSHLYHAKERLIQCKMVIKPKVYRRTRTMLKIRCTDIRQTRHNYSQLTELEKAKFQTPPVLNERRNCVKHNSAENVSQDLVHLKKSDTSASASFDFESEEREEIAEIADVPAATPAHTPAPVPALERVKEQSHTPGSRKSMRKNLGRPASSFNDFYM